MRERFLVLSVALVLSIPVIAADSKKSVEPKTELQRILVMISEINSQAVNAGAKLRHGVVSMKTGEDGAGSGPVRACCGNNIEKMGKQFQQMGPGLRNLRTCYESTGDSDAGVQLNFVEQDATAVYQAVGLFGGSRTRDDAQAGYGNLSRTLLQLQKSAKELPECSAPASP
jgi:hypothetical protein